jgi:hypothetical protein
MHLTNITEACRKWWSNNFFSFLSYRRQSNYDVWKVDVSLNFIVNMNDNVVLTDKYQVMEHIFGWNFDSSKLVYVGNTGKPKMITMSVADNIADFEVTLWWQISDNYCKKQCGLQSSKCLSVCSPFFSLSFFTQIHDCLRLVYKHITLPWKLHYIGNYTARGDDFQIFCKHWLS